ncbi:MAG: LuxR C-terminal-related transcriptional regulator [Phycisphaerales bacterium]
MLWSALCEDSGADVAIIDGTGLVLLVSKAARRWPFSDDQARGKHLTELLAPDFAAERLAIIERCVREQKPLVVRSCWGGVPLRTVLRPFRSPDGRALVLATSRAAHEEGETERSDIETVRTKNNDDGPLAKLTKRELEVLSLIAQGHTTAQIAKMLFRSTKTIEAHRLSLGLKLKVKNRVELARIAIRAGLHQRAIPTPVPAPTDER